MKKELINKLNTITILEKECPICKHKNPKKTLVFEENDSLNIRIEKEKEIMRCDCCHFDIYNYLKQELDKK